MYALLYAAYFFRSDGVTLLGPPVCVMHAPMVISDVFIS
uniref:Uncharacterized protein n=1 Tax=Picea glauca TaxID=3330 RepID=A0A117NIS4_PICGL|nr:hypothetical protein ABT39_MTgene280 [Picea glauca]